MKKISDVIMTVLAVIVCLFLFPWLIMICWNAVMPTIFGLTIITYKQAFILYILCNLLFPTNRN